MVIVLALCLTSSRLSVPAVLASPHLQPTTLFLPFLMQKSRIFVLTYHGAESQEKTCSCCLYWEVERKNHCNNRGKGVLVCGSVSFFRGLILSFTGWMNDASANDTGSILLSGDFFTASMQRFYFGHVSTNADHLSDNHEVSRWWSQSCNRKISYSTRCLYLGSNCYSEPLYVHKLLKQWHVYTWISIAWSAYLFGEQNSPRKWGQNGMENCSSVSN